MHELFDPFDLLEEALIFLLNVEASRIKDLNYHFL
jgi:hypothetical protein